MSELFLTLTTWFFTARWAADSRITRRLAWALRVVSFVGSVVAVVFPRLWLPSPAMLLTSGSDGVRVVLAMLVLVLAPLLGMLFLAARFHSYRLPRLARQALWVVVVGALGGLMFVLSSVFGFGLVGAIGVGVYVLGAGWGFGLLHRMARSLTVLRQEWLLDVTVLPRVEWTLYALLRDGRVELVGPLGEVSWFDNEASARSWLTQQGFQLRGHTELLGTGATGHASSG